MALKPLIASNLEQLALKALNVQIGSMVYTKNLFLTSLRLRDARSCRMNYECIGLLIVLADKYEA